MERHSPNPQPFVLATTEQVVYDAQPLAPPAEVPVTFFNTGEIVVRLRVQGSTTYLPVGPATFITLNPSGKVYGTVDSGTGNLIVAAGVRAGSAGVTNSGALSSSELSALDAAYSRKQALWLLLRQAQLTNEYLARIIDEQLSERDLSKHLIDV